MSIVERERSHLVRRTEGKQLSQRQASERRGISVRQLKRLVRSWKQQGDAGLVSRQRGKPSNNRLVTGRPLADEIEHDSRRERRRLAMLPI